MIVHWSLLAPVDSPGFAVQLSPNAGIYLPAEQWQAMVRVGTRVSPCRAISIIRFLVQNLHYDSGRVRSMRHYDARSGLIVVRSRRMGIALLPDTTPLRSHLSYNWSSLMDAATVRRSPMSILLAL